MTATIAPLTQRAAWKASGRITQRSVTCISSHSSLTTGACMTIEAIDIYLNYDRIFGSLAPFVQRVARPLRHVTISMTSHLSDPGLTSPRSSAARSAT